MVQFFHFLLCLFFSVFYLNKQVFWDSVYLRFGIQLPRLPVKCVCGSKFDVEHALSCKIGGFVGIRHNDVRDFTAEILDEVCSDVAVEPLLTPLSGEQFNLRSANTEEHARLDVSARGVWVRGSRAFFDIMVFNPLAPSYSSLTLKASHKSNENMKKRKYNDRILQVEHGTFTPLIFTNFGGIGVEGSNFYKKIADCNQCSNFMDSYQTKFLSTSYYQSMHQGKQSKEV